MEAIPTTELFKDGQKIRVNTCDIESFLPSGWKPSKESISVASDETPAETGDAKKAKKPAKKA